ncbi:hypothetical protein SHELI_v1c07650 [Spiroplasma helicoides]|uniref:Metallo-beta-lactamase domain-containing protein n=1 Tax=Spiroplasma helicoides TaxID=216938 RepID=A0A1B3SLA1_9MOLU|nr:MBL fold metallo-hydrolase [Spiroplasma helicoides]AOG60714.1 hypothetical protein SHELI_v1c07650 [Spiroplasma helicoides]
MAEIRVFTNDEINFVHAYMIINEKKEAILIDVAAIPEKIVEYCKENNVKITNILITHGHFDHIYKLNLILKVFDDAKIYIGKKDAICLYDKNYNLSTRRDLDWQLEQKNENVIEIKKNQVVTLNGYECNFIYIKGHTPGTVFYYFVSQDIMFCGDTLFKKGVGLHGKMIPRCSNSKFKKSIKYIYKNFSDNLTIYPGHHDYGFKLKDAKEGNEEANLLIKYNK